VDRWSVVGVDPNGQGIGVGLALSLGRGLLFLPQDSGPDPASGVLVRLDPPIEFYEGFDLDFGENLVAKLDVSGRKEVVEVNRSSIRLRRSSVSASHFSC